MLRRDGVMGTLLCTSTLWSANVTVGRAHLDLLPLAVTMTETEYRVRGGEFDYAD